MSLADSARLPAHQDGRTEVCNSCHHHVWQNHRINRVIEPGGVLYYASTYYGNAMHGIVEELGIKNDIVMRYVSTPSEIPMSEKSVYLAGRWPRGGLSKVEDDFTITSVKGIVFRLTPLRIEITSPVEDSFVEGQAVPLKAKVTRRSAAGALRVEFLIDSLPIAVDTEPPYEFNWLRAEKGRYVVNAEVHDDNGNIALSAPVTFFVGMPALERRVATSADDAEEQVDGSVSLNSSDLDMVAQSDRDSQRDDQVLGIRFTGLRISMETRIKEAYLQFTVDEVGAEPAELIIHAELAGNALEFTEVIHDISSRKRTSAVARWSPEPWEVRGERSMKQRTPDLSALIEEVIAQPDWQAGNALVFIISGSGSRVAVSYDGAQGSMPQLYIERR